VQVDRRRAVEALLVQNFVALPAACFRRSAALAAGGFDESIWYAADWDLWLKLARGGPVVYDNRALAGFRLHAEAQTMTRAEPVERRRQLECVLARHLPADGVPPRGLARAARFSVEVNVALARRVSGESMSLVRLALTFAALGPLGGLRYVRDSRILERLWSRSRVRFSPAGTGRVAV
jgi:hypothetical protein